MPKPHTFPTLYDDVLQISLTRLKEWGYLKPNQIMPGKINWSRNGEPIGEISIRVDTMAARPYIELNYNWRKEPRNYKVFIVSVPSNLGKGNVLYFLCPHTNKCCRKLYSIGGYFLHRDAFKGCMYESQIQSKKGRLLINAFDPYIKKSQYYSEINKKHFKKYYAGKPTKRYLWLLEQIEKAEKISHKEFEAALMFG